MAHFLISAGEEIQKHFREKEVNQTNTTFKLFSKVTFALCIFASILVGGTQYFGQPMNCDLGAAKDVVSQDFLNDHCWIHGTTHIPESHKEFFDCHYEEGSDQNKHLYYQWVVFMLVINALLFKIPHLIWKNCEGGLMKEFFSGKGLRARFLSEDKVNENLVVDLGYYMKLRGKHNTYYFIFQACQLLNIIMLGLNWWATNKFLGGNFNSYGSDIIKFYSQQENSYVESEKSNKFDPRCNTFPTQVSCDVTTASTSGAINKSNAICILSQNIINEKIYLFLWFWFVLMFVVSAIQLIFEIAIFAIPSFRSFVIARQTGSYLSGNVKNFIEQDCNHGDWFVLHQIGKNTNRDFYFRFLEKLEESYHNRNGEKQKLLKENQTSSGNVTIPMDAL